MSSKPLVELFAGNFWLVFRVLSAVHMVNGEKFLLRFTTARALIPVSRVAFFANVLPENGKPFVVGVIMLELTGSYPLAIFPNPIPLVEVVLWVRRAPPTLVLVPWQPTNDSHVEIPTI
jgi:hypothetical protein